MNSMTGFGRGQTMAEGWRVDAELGSVNRKQLDVAITLPRDCAWMDSHAQTLVRARVRRGFIKGAVRILRLDPSTDNGPDPATARRRIDGLRRVAAELGLADDLSASTLLHLSNTLPAHTEPESGGDAILPLLHQALAEALDAMNAMRAAEGKALSNDLAERLNALRGMLPALRARAPGVIQAYRENLLRRIQEAGVPLAEEHPSLLREIALFADRCDISEELTRLESHFDQAEALLQSEDPCGRALDFLCQELFREINTVGSKANDALLTRGVIRFKAELEAVREQVQNVE